MQEVGMMNNTVHTFETSTTLVQQLSKDIVLVLTRAIQTKGKATLAVSGGSTPKTLFETLSTISLQWDKVTVTLADERWVSEENKDSNANFVKTTLLQNKASKATFLSLYEDTLSVFDAQEKCSAAIGTLLPFDVVILGMGLDGHTASLFPSKKSVAAAWETKANCIAVTPKDAPYLRMSLTPHVLQSAHKRILHFEGKEKWAVYKQAEVQKECFMLPISSFLQDKTAPWEVYYA